MEGILSKGFYKKMMALALPIALQNLLSSCAAIVDTAMVVGLGNVSTAAIGVAGRWSFLITLVMFGFCSGSSVMISQYWGAREEENIHRTFGAALAFSAILSFVYMVCAFVMPEKMMSVFTNEQPVIEAGAKYLRIVCFASIPNAYSMMVMGARRSTEDVKTPIIASASAVLINTCLNYILIYGHFGAPKLGLVGAGVATLISAISQMVIMFGLGWKQRHFTFAAPKKLFALKSEFVRKYIKVASPVILNETLWAIAFNIYSMIYARQGSENYAAYTMFGTIQDLAFVFFVGVCNACAIMIGKTVGRGKLDDAYHLAKRFVVMTPLMGLVIGAALALVRTPILSIMNVETEYARQMASNLLLFYGLWLPVRMIPYTCVVGVFRAGGDTKTGFFIDVGTMYFWSIPIVALVAYVFHAPFFWIVASMFISEDILKAVVCLLHFKGRGWIRRITTTNLEEPPENDL